MIRIAADQQQIKAVHHKKVKPWREFQIENLVLKHDIRSIEERDAGKLGENWEEPYIIIAKGEKGFYTLVTPRRNTPQTLKFFSSEAILCVISSLFNEENHCSVSFSS